jgi:glycosyltransferase involved in cell wall biosynthesis
MDEQKGISVVICCYNSSVKLFPTLEHLAKQDIDNRFPWEIIIIDNNSTDDTVSLAQEWWKELGNPAPLSIEYEKKPGAGHARNKGVWVAAYDYILFCDDDNWLDKNYLALGFDILSAHSEFGLLSGRNEGITEGAFPEWFYSMQGAFAVGTPYLNSRDITKFTTWSAGLFGRKLILRKVFSEIVPLICNGRTGDQPLSGEDNEICKRTALLGYKIQYDYRLFFRHFMAKERLNETYVENLWKGFGPVGDIMKIYDKCIAISMASFKSRIYLALSSMLKIIFGLFPGQKRHFKFGWDNLYLLTGIRLFSTPQSRLVYHYFKKVAVPFRAEHEAAINSIKKIPAHYSGLPFLQVQNP